MRILITGNGFDPSFGLPIAESDFIRICKKLLAHPESNRKNLKQFLLPHVPDLKI